ncbi:MAG TPA: SpvB/TcaC N-terminal domain-containing protein, partial [Saprospiraceae bacterium]|nr:SpvB/TcaC N-terminal domain-containing protein [Saprospiraceae bacterium]
MSNLLNKVKIGNVLISLFFLFCTYSIKSQNSSQTENTSKNEQAPINDQNSKSSNDASNTKNNIEITKANSDPTPLFNTENLTASFDKKSQKSISANEISGALNYLFNITIPPGRNNFQPDIKLKYSNQDGSSTPNIIGYGWNIEIPTISRINKSGTNKLYSSDYFYSSMSGELIKVAGNSNVYAPKVENGDFLTYTLSSGSWIVKDKKGTIFKFGSLAQSRQDNPNKNTEVYKWSLDEIRNTDNNYIKFEYFKNDGQIYPDKITYTGNGSIDGIFKIEFLRESRNDILKSYATAFLVTTNYRISEIKISINNTWVRKYQLSYSVGDNGYRSLLSSIIESGQDENSNVISLPPTSFNYYESQAGWTLNTSNWTSPTLFANGFQSMLDINGDALPDIIESYKPSMTTPNVFKTYINKNNGTWGINSGLQPPIIFRDREVRGGSYENSWDQGVRIGDVNGDLLPDIIKAEDNEHGKGGFDAYINTNGDTWTQSNNWHPTITFNGDDNIDSWGSHLLDLNADGLPDVIRKKQTPFFGSQINQGSIFGQESHSELNLPLEDLTGPKTRLIDLNGDNLPDVINMVWNQSKVDYDQLTYLNAGNGNWILDNSGNWDLPVEIVHSDNTTDSGARFFDVNADGLPDLVPDFTLMESGRDTYLNTGSGWTCAVEWNVPEDVQINFDSQPISIIDLNSDGTLDFFITQNSNPAITKAFINNTSTPTDALKKVILPEGGYIDFVYKNSPLYKDASNNQLNTHLPLTLMTVHQITTNDLNGVSSTDTYSYEGGEYFFSTWDNRKPSGFSKITKKDNLGIQSISYYHQGNTTNSSKGEFADHYSKIGKVYRTELLDSIGNIFHVTINKWDKYNLGSDRDYVKLDRTTILTYDGDSDHKDLSTTFTYDSVNGNLIKQVNWGEVSGQNDGSFSDLGNDKYTTDITYAINQANYILGLPKQVIITNQAGLKVRENKFYYDNLTFGNVNKGNLTTEEKWKSASEYISLKKTYDGIFGLVTIEKDGKDNATIYTFDSYYLYPSSIKNPLLDSINYSYDYSLGKPKKVTDQNNFIYETVYDALDRIKEERIPNYLAPYSPIVKTSYAYTNTPGAISILKSDYLDSTNSINTFQYFDGLNRLIQERIEAEDSNKYSARDIIYNPVGLVYKESLPYFSTGSVKTSPTTATNLYNVFTYDADKRLKNITNSIGTTITTYDDWKTSVIDPNGKVKNSYKDAFNNIIQVDEINNGASYITKYEWNGNNKLTKVTDALGNIRIFTYDGLGRRLTAEDLHVVGDQTFGTWSYTYDNADNIINIVDPKNQSTNFTYNALNQVLSEDFTGGTGTEISYTYSGCLNGIDLLCNVVTNNGINTSYSYNSNHLIANELKTINGINYSTLFNYDRQYNNTEIINPDTSAVRYTYNSAGLPEKIELKEGGSNYSALVNNFDYGPHRKIIKQQNNNKTETITSYDPNKMYRLSRILTNSYKNVNYKSEDTSINLINKDQATIKPRNIESAKLSAISSVKTFQSSASGDGEVLATNTNWNTVREATTGTANSSATIGYASTQWWSWTSPKEINRMTLPFNTSDLPDDASIISANLKVYVLQVYNNENDGNDFIRVVQNTTESPTALVAEDYDQIGELNNPIAGSSDIDLGTIAINEYLSFSLNTTGQSWINKTGWSKLGLREGHDAMNDPLTAPGGSAIKIYT